MAIVISSSIEREAALSLRADDDVDDYGSDSHAAPQEIAETKVVSV